MDTLNLPAFPFKIIKEEGKHKIFDPVRRKYLVITPEEWVRQHFIQYLVGEKGFPQGLLKMESGVKHGQTTGRYDALFMNPKGEPLVLIECKAPSVQINQETFYQIARYNSKLKVPFLAITNGLEHFFLELDFNDNRIKALTDIPSYDYLVK